MKKFFKKSVSTVLAVIMIVCASSAVIMPNALTSNLAGDINADGKVNNKDVVSLFRYVSGSVGEDKVDVCACDTNGDKKINNKDVVTLFRYITGSVSEIFYTVSESDNVYKVWNNDTLAAFEKTKQTTVSLDTDGVKLTASSTINNDPYVIFNLQTYQQLTGKPALPGINGSYVVLKIRSGADGYIEAFARESNTGCKGASVMYKPDDQFHYVVIDMTDADFTDGTGEKTAFTSTENLSVIRIDWAGSGISKSSSLIISEIGFFTELDKALEYTSLSEADLTYENADVLTFPESGKISAYVTVASSEKITASKDNGKRTAKITSTKTSSKITVNLRSMAEAYGKAVKTCDYLAVRLRVKDQSDLKVSLFSVYDVSGASVTASGQTATVDCVNDGWQGVIFNTKNINLHEDHLKKIVLMLSDFNTGGSVEIGGFLFSDSLNDALAFSGHSEYCLNYDSSLTDNDELSDSVLAAPDEDPSLDLWFDQSTEKVNRDDTESTGRSGYTVRMAKNETENCQFFLAPENNTRVRIEVDPFTNANSDTVQHELAFEYYHNINNTMIPDALPELTGAIDIASGNSQGFVIRLTTTSDTPAGLYESVIHVYDDETGKEIKRAPVAVKVWDFALSEETELRTAFGLWMSYVYDSYPDSKWTSEQKAQLEDNYYAFFLKYRINIMDVPHGLTSGAAKKYLSNPRVNTVRWSNLDMSIAEDNNGITPDFIDRVIYYTVDEPGGRNPVSTDLETLRNHTGRVKANTPDYRYVITFERNPDLMADGSVASSFEASDTDLIGYLSDYINIWCPKYDAFTPRDLGFLSGVTYVQSKEQDDKYGAFADRMAKEVEEGDELWAYIAIDPTEPYVNWQLLSDGTETIVSLWQAKQNNVTGLLYWAVNYWKVNYWGQSQPWTGSAYGDGMLIYSGHTFGSLYPVPTLRLENIRDGIEDYQMLCMLQDALGEQAVSDMLKRITTSVATYATDDDYVHAVRVLLGDTLEEALNK